MRSPRRWACWQLPRAARVLVLTVPVLHAAIVVLGVAAVHFSARDVVTASIFAAASVISVEVSMRLAWPRTRGDLISSDGLAVWILPVALLLPPVYVALMVVIPRLYVQIRVWRAQTMKFVYSTATLGLAYAAGAEVHRLVLGTAPITWKAGQLLGGTRPVLAVLAAIAVWWVAHNLLVFAVVALTAGRAPVIAFLRNRETHVVDAVAICIGTATAVLWIVHPAAAALLAPAVLLMQHQLYSGLRQAVRRDLLTNVSNPQFWREAARREVDRAWASGTNLAVLVIDLDHFKAINDRHGHLAGDDVLAATARAIAAALRPSDLIGRLGGEEFGAVLSGLDLPDAQRAAERVRAHAAATRVRSDRGDWITVTASIGIAELPTNGNDLTELLDAADTAMYAAKTAGRDTIHTAEPQHQPTLGPAYEQHQLLRPDHRHNATEEGAPFASHDPGRP
ncbi:MAG TPA: GGDEF domain-containing protein [Acidothermaceae bacterium]